MISVIVVICIYCFVGVADSLLFILLYWRQWELVILCCTSEFTLQTDRLREGKWKYLQGMEEKCLTC